MSQPQDQPPPYQSPTAPSDKGCYELQAQTGGQAESPKKIIQMPPAPVLGMDPVDVVCPKCKDTVRTSVKKDFQGWGWVLALCCCAGCICAVVPCCMDDLYEFKHCCPKSECRHAIGSYEPKGNVCPNGRKILTGILIVGICVTVVVVIRQILWASA